MGEKLDEKETVTFKELLMANAIQVDALCQILIEKGVFAEHMRTNQILGTSSSFCEPFHSYELGTVENTIGLVRRFLPKKTNLATISQDQLTKIESWLNTRPRKCLAFKTPAEVFNAECCT